MVSAFLWYTFAPNLYQMQIGVKHISEEERILADKIYEAAQNLFLSIGVRSVTMDDLSGHLGISKKTLYQFIDNKAELVHYIVERDIAVTVAHIEEITKDSKDAIDEMLLIGKLVIE